MTAIIPSHAKPDAELSARQSTIITLILCGAAFMAMLDVFVVHIAFAQIGREFSQSSLADLSWILNGYTIVYAALLIPSGRLADNLGRKAGFLIGLAIFTLASVGCAVAPTLWWLVFARVAQAVGAAALTPTSLGLLLSVLPASRRVGAVKTWATTSAIAGAIGPALGGMLAEYSWRWVFLINLPVGIVAGIAAALLLPASARTATSPVAKPDFTGALILGITIAAISLGLIERQRTSGTQMFALGVFVVIGLIWLVVRIRNHPSPIVQPALFRIPTFVWANVTVLLFCTAFGALFLSVAVWLQTAAGLSLIEAGIAMVPGPVAVPITAYLVQRLTPGASARSLIICGNLVFGLGALFLAAMASAHANYFSETLPGWIVIGVGIGMALPTMIATATRDVPAGMAATGSGVVNTSRQLGYVFGVALLVAATGSFALPPEQVRSVFQFCWVSIAFIIALSAAAALGLRPQGQQA